MRFDSTPYYHVGEMYSWDTLMEEMHQEVRLIDQGGFTGLWLAEHHFAWDGWYRASPNPILLGAGLIKNSDHLRIGQCGTILPDWHPLRVAEDIALLDNFTDGRVDFGVARGFDTRASAQFNAVGDRRNPKLNSEFFNEALDVIIDAWNQDAFQYRGRHYTFPEPGWREPNSWVRDPRYHAEDGEMIALGVHPKPVQKPHPPIFQMSTSNRSHELAGRRGIATMCQTVSLGKIREIWNTYYDAARDARGEENDFGDKLAVMIATYVADTMEEAEKAVRPGANMLGVWNKRDPVSASKDSFVDGEIEEGDLDLDWFDFQSKHDLIMVGTPDTVAEQIERYRMELNCQHIALFLNFPGLSFRQVMNSLTLFAEQVIPRFN